MLILIVKILMLGKEKAKQFIVVVVVVVPIQLWTILLKKE
jgi:hypothetical protein